MNENCPTIFQASTYEVECTGTIFYLAYIKEEKFEYAFKNICVRTLTNCFARQL